MIDYIYLKLQNPWWEKMEAVNDDEKLREFDSLKYQFQPNQILNLTPRPKDIHLITGPRQTGKSTAIKLFIRNLQKDKFNLQSVLYFNCDALSTQKDIIDLVLEFTKLNEEKESIIFLDEISSVSNWPAGIKWLVDTGLLKKSALFLTGSSSINLKKSGEFLPGRRGGGKDLAFLPVSFFDYLHLKGVNLKKISLHQRNLLPYLNRVNDKILRYYDQFLATGGYLRNINYGLTETTNDLYLKTLKSELFKDGKKEDSLREVVRKIINSLSSQTSYTNIAEEAELGSKNTAIDYLNFLSDSFFLKEIKFYDINSNRVVLKKNKKFYTIDPYLIWLFEGFISGSLDFTSFRGLIDEAKLAENFVATELVKGNHAFYYFQNSCELDFYLPAIHLGIEVKYKNKITSDDMKPLNLASKKILVSKNTLEVRGDTYLIPIHLLSLIEF